MKTIKIKKQTTQKIYVIKRKVKFGNYKHCLKATRLETKIKQLEKYKLNVDSLTDNHTEFIKRYINIKTTAKL